MTTELIQGIYYIIGIAVVVITVITTIGKYFANIVYKIDNMQRHQDQMTINQNLHFDFIDKQFNDLSQRIDEFSNQSKTNQELILEANKQLAYFQGVFNALIGNEQHL